VKLVDTDVMIDIFRNYAPALAWLTILESQELGLPGLVVLELLQGCRNQLEQQKLEKVLRAYPRYWPTQADCERALNDYASYHLSHHLGILDALIAETAVGLGVELATFNEKHYRVVKELQIVQPYLRN
jgi:predicted nucleic acid-binding protein